MATPEFAVLIPILDYNDTGRGRTDHGGRPSVLLTLRRSDLPSYAGQVSCPGGAREAADSDLMSTALRETHEEVGIPADNVRVTHELGWFETTLGHRVKPFAAQVHGTFTIRANPDEVARILYVPVATLEADPFRIRGEFVDAEGKTQPVYSFDFDGEEIWGLTARILRSYFVAGSSDASGGVTRA